MIDLNFQLGRGVFSTGVEAGWLAGGPDPGQTGPTEALHSRRRQQSKPPFLVEASFHSQDLLGGCDFQFFFFFF